MSIFGRCFQTPPINLSGGFSIFYFLLFLLLFLSDQKVYPLPTPPLPGPPLQPPSPNLAANTPHPESQPAMVLFNELPNAGHFFQSVGLAPPDSGLLGPSSFGPYAHYPHISHAHIAGAHSPPPFHFPPPPPPTSNLDLPPPW